MAPFDWSVADFAALFAGTFVAGLLLALLLRWALRSPGGRPAEGLLLHPYEVAHLAGGPAWAVNAATARLVQSGQLTLGQSTGKLFRENAPPAGSHPLEQRLFEIAQGRLTVYNATENVTAETAALGKHLQELGLELNESQAARARWAPVVLLALVALFGAIKVVFDLGRGQSLDNLLLIACATPIAFAVLAGLTPPRRSRRGDRLLGQLREQNAALEARLRKESEELPGPELSLAVGLFGVNALATGPLVKLRYAVQHPPTSEEPATLPPPTGGTE